MGKNKQPKDEAPNPNSVANREIFQRLNFLYQASVYLKRLESPGPAPGDAGPALDTKEHARRGNTRKKGGKKRKASLGDLGSSYVRCMHTIGNKTVVRMDPTVKRSLCKGCDTVLVPGTTASVRVKSSLNTGHKVAYTCLACHTPRVIPAPPVAPAPAPAPAPALTPSPASSNAPAAPTPSTTLQDTLQVLHTPAPGPEQPQRSPHRNKKRKSPVPRPLPLFARPDAGHVVFRGNEMLSESRE